LHADALGTGHNDVVYREINGRESMGLQAVRQ
jgi:hypothetical protein